MRCRVSFLLTTWLWTLLVFIAAKVGFMMVCHEATPVLAMADVWQVIRHGLSLDLSTSLYFLIVPFLACIVSVWWRHAKVLRAILRIYFIIISLAFGLAFVADASLYPFWGFKLDASCLQYLETPTEAMASVTGGYLLWRLTAFIVIALVIFRGYLSVLRRHIQCVCTANSVSLVSKFSEFVVYLLLIPLMVIGIRGGLDESTTNIGQVYFSQNQFLNHSAVNPVFSFLSSFEKTASHIVSYDYYTDETCNQLMQGLYPTSSVGSDTLLNTTRPNIVIILMESAGEIYAEAMPRLQQFKKEGIDFANCFANSWRTDRGTVCTYSGYPSFPTSSVMKMPRKTKALPGIAATLRQEGYRTRYLYGGDINFTNMRSYLVATGWEQLTWKADYSAEEQGTAEWGVRDDITFKTLLSWTLEPVSATDAGAPILIGFSTLSSHQPWDVPIHHFDDEQLNAFYYLDLCLGDYIDRLKDTPQWKDLLIIILPDHSTDFRDVNESKPQRNRIPMVWLGGAVKEPRRIETLCNQTDLAATLLAQLHIGHEQFRWSRDVLSGSYVYPFAVHNFNNGFSITDSTGFMVYDLDSRHIMTNESTDAQRLERMGKAILQATTNDFKQIGNP